MPRPVILDCDPGHDDAVALLLAFASSELELLGVSVTHGNVPLERTLHNALTIRELGAANVPVYAGAHAPLVRAALHAEHVHGRSGLGDVSLPAPSRGPEAARAAAFLADTVTARPGEVSVVAVGPLTNVALAMRLEPRFARSVREIVLMGGSTDWGNATPAAEFNFLTDPHAARVVFESGAPISMFGLNLTRQVDVTRARVERLLALPSRAGRAAGELLADYLGRLEARGVARGALHDPCPVAYLIRPELFELQEMFVQVDAEEGVNFGRSVCDVTHASGREANARVAMRADADGVYGLLQERLARLP